MIGTYWVGDLEQATRDNRRFRSILHSGPHLELTVMSLTPGEESGGEVVDHDQFIWIEKGHARVEIGPSELEVTETFHVESDWGVIVPAGVWRKVVNVDVHDLKLFSVCAPPVDGDGTVHRTEAPASVGAYFST